MTDAIVISLPDGREIVARQGDTPADIAARALPPSERNPIGAMADNEPMGLDEPLLSSCRLCFLGLGTTEGLRVHERSLIVMLVKAVRDVFPDRRVIVRHALTSGVYFEVVGSAELLPDELTKIAERMRELSASRIPFRRLDAPGGLRGVSQRPGERGFVREPQSAGGRDCVSEPQGPDDKGFVREPQGPGDPETSAAPKSDEDSLSRRAQVSVAAMTYEFGGFVDSVFGYLAPHSGFVDDFSLLYHYPGAVVTYPRIVAERKQQAVPLYNDMPKLIGCFARSKEWGRILGIESVEDWNAAVRSGASGDIIRVAEALQEKQIARIADIIANSPAQKRLVLIAGPSSSGKTTFANRLAIQLRVDGLKASLLSMDNYYLPKAMIPPGPDGAPDLESPDALDIPLFTRQMQAAAAGEEVFAPTYDFRSGVRADGREPLATGKDHVIVVEGINGLNPRISAGIPKERKHKVYISALTSLRIGDRIRIPTTDSRLVRRLVRDRRSRNTPVIDTIRMWASVRAGEDRYIFPYQDACDSIFDSGLIYDLSVLRGLAMPLLGGIGRERPEHADAMRLLKLLECFEPVSGEDVPPNSILREFLGDSCFGA